MLSQCRAEHDLSKLQCMGCRMFMLSLCDMRFRASMLLCCHYKVIWATKSMQWDLNNPVLCKRQAAAVSTDICQQSL